MVLVASVLILQMVFWMRKHGRTMRSDLEQGAAQSLARTGWWGVATIAAVAVAREGSETVVFLFGILAGGGDISAVSIKVMPRSMPRCRVATSSAREERFSPIIHVPIPSAGTVSPEGNLTCFIAYHTMKMEKAGVAPRPVCSGQASSSTTALRFADLARCA